MNRIWVIFILLITWACHDADEIVSDVFDTQTVRYQNHKWRFHYDPGPGPTLVFDHGAGDTLYSFLNVFHEVDRMGEVYIWDRSGNGVSDWDGSVRTAQNITGELDLFLDVAGAEPPYILVGHSLGGLNMMAYAKRYPEKVEAILLIDPSHWDQPNRCIAELPDGACITEDYLDDLRNPMRDELSHFDSYQTLLLDGSFPDIPVTVLTADEFDPIRQHGQIIVTANEWANFWYDLQDEIVDLTQARHVTRTRSEHYIHQQNEDLFLDELRRLVNQF